MATVSASLKMFDQMTRPLQQVTQALNLTISAMDNMNNSANKDIKIANTLNTARTAMQNANAGLNQLANSQDRAANEQNRLNNTFNKGSSSADSLTSKIKGLVGAYLGFQTIKKGIDLTIGGAGKLEQQLITISGMLGNKDVGKAFFENLNKYANESVYGLKEFNTITRSFIQFTKNTDKLMDLNKTAEKLAFLDPSQGLEGAGFALKEAMGGDFMSLKQRFGFGKADAEILKASKSMDEFISKFDTLLNKKGATDQALQEFNQSAIAQMDNLKSNIETSFAQAGERGLEILKPLLSRINEGFKNGSFNSFFEGVGNGLNLIVDLTMKVIEGFQWVGNIVSSNWGIIEPIIWGIVAALIVYNATMGIGWLTTIRDIGAKIIHTAISWGQTAAIIAMTLAQQGLNAALAMCPISWIIIGIIILIALFYAAVAAVNHFVGTSISATGIIAGVFTALGAHIYNIFAYVWNFIASFVEFFANVFNHPVYSVKKLFVGLATNVLDMCISMTEGFDGVATNLANAFIDGANMAIKAVNWIIDALNKIPGVDIGKAGEIGGVGSITSSLKGVKKDLNAWLGDAPADYWTAPKMEMKSIGGAFDTGYDWGENLSGKFNIGNLFGDMNKASYEPPELLTNMMDDWNNAQVDNFGGAGDLGKNAKGAKDHLKNIDDKIDISNEHLEMLRDLAEMESVQNFVTLTPTVQVTTGDVKEEADINKIISKIESYMENELVSSAEGVYA
ncbi:hypothetical protein [Clostridium algidicarnis]|uniref:hypothetical protein n=1 Tax=Clostridium algidicarnis TaxID=37659 RepID=UPI001C0CDDA3|nr:hypothetical protein [Clostridium algidicarnis]MBU3193462.1 hypothetical protein [Clostridium algidicarnis]MBU3203133.1 hypothetical protein [Clostridium algidicarnis]MBU3211287.1 hypothetical protein [Clostridium algidicarnis]MBU3222205.1 hypothetical protein [Clostridium algidicarnis]